MAGEPHPSVTALLPAAGMGLRLGQGPKALLRLGERSLLELCILALAQVADRILVAAPAGFEASFRQLAPTAVVITGGASRQETVHLLARAAAAAAGELLLVHDAARPFLPPAAASRVLAAASEYGAASAAMPVTDSLVSRNDGVPVDRESLLAVQTPQAFRSELLLAAHGQALSAQRTATDDAELVRQLGQPVVHVDGSPWLFKVTHPGDLQLARLVETDWPEVLDEPGDDNGRAD